MSACLLWAPPPRVGFYTADERRKTWLHRAMIGRSACGGLTATARTSAGHRPIILLLYTLLDLRPIIVRWSHGGPAEINRFLAIFSQEKSDGGPQVTARCLDGVPAVAGGWRNYPRNRPIIRQILTAELNLPDRRRMRAQGVLNRRMAVGFLQDSSQGSVHGDPAIEFPQLWRSSKTLWWALCHWLFQNVFHCQKQNPWKMGDRSLKMTTCNDQGGCPLYSGVWWLIRWFVTLRSLYWRLFFF